VASTIARDICNGLFQIHKKNFIHRDLKPENILINESLNDDGSIPQNPEDMYQAKIADFGLSAEVHSNVFRGQDKIVDVTGTILFMAPEQATGQRYGKRVDMWALGIIVFQMLTGKHPFHLSSDTADSYVDRIDKQPIDKLLTQSFEKYEISQSA
jgi:serine/threonine protein kinase